MENNLYEKEVHAAEKHLHELEEKINDLKVSYDYSNLKSSFAPYEMQSQIEILDKMILRKALHNDKVGHIGNYGTFMTVMKNFDTFQKKEEPLKEQAMRIVLVERAIKEANDYLKTHQELLPRANYTMENPELFKLAHEYLRKIPSFDSFDRQEYRSAIVKQAMMDLSEDDIKKAISRRVIQKRDITGLDNMVTGVTDKERVQYETNYRLVINAFSESREEVVPENVILNTRAVGVTYENEDGTLRQDVLKDMKDDPSPEIELKKGEYKGNPSYAILYHSHQAGFLPQPVADTLTESYGESPVKAEVIEVTGGYEKRTKEGEISTASYGLKLKLTIALTRQGEKVEKEKEIEKEAEKEMN